MRQDDGVRSKNGVVACLREINSSTLRLIFDDVTTLEPRHPVKWNTKVFYTFNDYDKNEIHSLNLSQKKYAKIGQNLLISLLSLEGKLK